MPNTITNLIPDLYEALDIVSRELVGFIPSVTLDAEASRAAVNQAVRVFQTRAGTVGNITPGVTPPDDGDQTVDNVSITITKARRSPIRWNGEQTLGLNNNGAGQRAIYMDQLQQSIRALVNEMEADIYTAARVASSRAYGTAGTAPFGSSVADAAQIRKILDDNGCPMGNRSLVMDTRAGVALRSLTHLTKANEAGTVMTLRDGELLNLFGLSVKESAAIAANYTKGTGASYVIDGTGNTAVGSTVLKLKTGSGTILAGDVIKINNLEQYVVTGDLTGGLVTIGAPGLRIAVADGQTVAVQNASACHMAFHKSAIVLATRAPALPPNGDLAVDRTIITDPRSGMSFEVAMYPQYRQMQYEISAAWGVKGIKEAHVATLFG
jgi:hypothetical protein